MRLRARLFSGPYSARRLIRQNRVRPRSRIPLAQQVGDPRTSLAHVGEGVGKSCPCVHLDQQFRQVYLRQHPLGQRAELHETRWILESIQPGEDEFLAPACYLNPNRSVLPPAVARSKRTLGRSALSVARV